MRSARFSSAQEGSRGNDSQRHCGCHRDQGKHPAPVAERVAQGREDVRRVGGNTRAFVTASKGVWPRHGSNHGGPAYADDPPRAHSGCFNAAASTGIMRSRLPVAAKIALATAGTIAEVPASPIPPGGSEF